MFFTYHQNNSGGGFDHDTEKGIGYYVIIEANDSDESDRIAENIGLYFNGCDSGMDCECCGDRWGSAWEQTEVPSIYGEDVSSGEYADSMWGIGSYIHYKDGRIVKIRSIKNVD